MATRLLLKDLAAAWKQRTGFEVRIESVGGVEAARRVQADEVFDLVVLAEKAIDALLRAGHLVAGSDAALVQSGVAVCVRAGEAEPAINTEAALRSAVLAARSIGYSTGPSGVALIELFERWGIAADVLPRCVQAPPGVPVAALVARGEVLLGFQQRSELMFAGGITVIGPLPDAVQITTTFSAALGVHAARAEATREFLGFLTSPDADADKRRNGMQPA